MIHGCRAFLSCSWLAFLSALCCNSPVEAAQVLIDNQTNFQIRVRYSEGLRQSVAEDFLLEPHTHERVSTLDEQEIRFRFENISPYSEGQTNAMKTRLLRDLGIATTVTGAALALAPLAAPALAVAGAITIAAKFYRDCTYQRKCALQTSAAEPPPRAHVITLLQDGAMTFRVQLQKPREKLKHQRTVWTRAPAPLATGEAEQAQSWAEISRSPTGLGEWP